MQMCDSGYCTCRVWDGGMSLEFSQDRCIAGAPHLERRLALQSGSITELHDLVLLVVHDSVVTSANYAESQFRRHMRQLDCLGESQGTARRPAIGLSLSPTREARCMIRSGCPLLRRAEP